MSDIEETEPPPERHLVNAPMEMWVGAQFFHRGNVWQIVGPENQYELGDPEKPVNYLLSDSLHMGITDEPTAEPVTPLLTVPAQIRARAAKARVGQLREDVATLLNLLERASAACVASGDTEVSRSKAYSQAYDLENADRAAQRGRTSYWLANRIRIDDGEMDL